MNDVVSKRILRKHERLRGDFEHQRTTLFINGVVDATLKNATTVSVSRNLNTVHLGRVIDELVVFSRQSLKAPLNYVVTIQVLDQSNDPRS